MTVRTSRKSISFARPFSLPGIGAAQPAGTYTIETLEELIDGLSFQAYRRLETTIRLRAASGQLWLDRFVPIDPLELESAQKRDRIESNDGRPG